MILVVAATEPELAGADGAEQLVCGIGPVEAAAVTARALAERRPDALLHVGIAGATGIEPPALVIGLEAMEGFGVLRAAALAGVPAVELRAVSNAVDETDRSLWRFDDAFAALADG